MIRTAFDAPPGGVMTDEAGAVTGELETWLDGTDVRLAYVGAHDVYTVTGSPVPGDLTVEQVVAHLTAPPPDDEYGNPVATDLNGLTAPGGST